MWAEERGIPVLAAAGDIFSTLSQRPFDYLFSVNNETILSEEVLSLPNRLAINYHDALLPSYAGNYATSWAIMRGEAVHGVTWHVMSSQVDAGDILKQRQVHITAGETAFTLNAKCYEAAILSFEELVNDISRGEIKATAQDLKDRTFFPLDKRPDAGCVLSWHGSAHEIAAMVRALDFGNYANPLGRAKLAIANQLVIVEEVTVLDSPATNPPGTITELGDDFITVSTGDCEVALRKLSTIEGQPLSLSELSSKFALRKGFRFKELDSELRKGLTELYKSCCKREKFWTETLMALQPLAPFTARIDGRNQNEKCGTAAMRLPPEVCSFLRSINGTWDKCDFLITAFAVYLSRVAQNSCFDIGFGDQRVELYGFFAPHVPLRIEVEGFQDFREALSSISQRLRLVNRHKTYARDLLSRIPELRTRVEQGIEYDLPFAVERTASMADYDVASCTGLTLVIPEDRAECYWVYSQTAFDENTIARMMRQFEILMSAVANDPGQPIARLPLLSDEDRHRLLVEWNDTAADCPQEQCIHQLFEARAENSPEEVAVRFEAQTLSYGDLNRRANQLAHHLRKSGVGPEVMVGICLDRSLDLPVGLLGILKAGGAYLPLDPAYPEDRLSFMLKDSGTSVLLTEEQYLEKFPDFTQRIICLTNDRQTISFESEENVESAVTPASLAYVIYTSGSSGKPKGVSIPHRALVNHSTAISKCYNLSSSDRMLQFASISFDVAGEELFPPWLAGATVVLQPERARASLSAFLEFLKEEQLTVINLPTSFWQEFISDLSSSDLPATLRLVVVGNEKAHPEAFLAWQRLVGDRIRLMNAYGPTETTITSSTYEFVPGKENYQTQCIPIGRPIANVQMYLLDGHLQPVPVGIGGELHIGGAGLARGYLNHAELTAQKFIGNPFSADPEARLYKTGDLARYLPDGQIEFLGRKDDQVKVRGFRIEPGEIETVLSQSSMVRQAAVIAREDRPGEKRLVAYVVLKDGNGNGNNINLGPSVGENTRLFARDLVGMETELPSKLSRTDLREYLIERLPDYMVPSAFVVLDALPTLPNGKVDRSSLPTPADESLETRGGFVCPSDAFERYVVKVWEKVLGKQPIGVHDNFFDLGGNSLVALRMFAEVEKQFGKSLPLATLFHAPTVGKLCRVLREQGWQEPWSSLVPIQKGGTKPPFFCIHAAGGNVLFYRDLVRRLGMDQPFYGLQARGLDGKQPHHTRIEDMAGHYIDEIRRVQPQGPYFLGGASFGGLVAFEMARQIDASGQKVAFVGLFDAHGPGYPRLLPTTSAFAAKVIHCRERIEHHLGNLVILDWQGRLTYLREKRRKAVVKFIRGFRDKRARLARKLHLSPPNPLPTKLQEAQNAIMECFRNYVPQVYPGSVTLFRASRQPSGIYPDPTLGWGGLAAGGLVIHDVPGLHGSMLTEPRVQVLAEKLTECLSRAPASASQAAQHQVAESWSIEPALQDRSCVAVSGPEQRQLLSSSSVADR
jgi:amino acid adenylation domain-containing protein